MNAKVIACLRVVGTTGTIFDSPAVEGFDFRAFCQDVRANGYFFNDALYVPYDKIAFMTLIPPDGQRVPQPASPLAN